MGILDRYLQKRGFVKAEDIEQKSVGFMELETASNPTNRPDQDRIADYGTFINAYRRLPWLYAGVTALAIAATKPVLRAYREVKTADGVDQVEVTGEDLNALLELPNPNMSYIELLQVTIINLALLGNQYWNLVGTREKTPISKTNPPVEIWWVKPEQIQPKPNPDGTVGAYTYTSPIGKEKDIDASEIIHFKLVNPGSYHLGLGMMEPLMTTNTLEFNAMNFERYFMENNGTPPFVFEHPGSPTDEQRKTFYRDWDERHKGPKKVNRPGMIWGGMKTNVIGATMKDAQYPELRKMNREETLAAIGTPPSVVGLLEYANYSNMEVQQKKFWEDTVIPILGLIADKLTLRLAPLFDERIWFEFDYSNIKVLQEDEERKSRIAATLIQNGLKTPNQLRSSMYNDDPYEGGDQYYMGMSLLPVGFDKKAGAAKRIKAATKVKAEGEDDKPKDSFWTSPERKKVLWLAFDKRVSSQERAILPEIEKYLHGQADEVYARAASAESVADIKPANLFDIEAEVHVYADKFEPRYRQAFERAGNAGFQATKGMIWIPPEERKLKDVDEFRVTPEHLAKLRAQIELAANYFNETTWKTIRVELERAGLENPTVQEVANALKDKLDDRAAYEARRIARTEMASTENWGGLEGYKQNEYVTMKGWLAQPTEDSRDGHLAADGQEVLLNEDFMVTGPDGNREALAYPGDPKASAGNRINCNCTEYPVVQ